MLPPCAGSLRLPPSALLPPAGCAVDALPLLPPLADEPPTSALLGSPPLAAPGFDAPWPEHAARSAANTSGTRARCPVVIALHSSALISRGRVKHPVSFHSRVRRFLTRFASSNDERDEQRAHRSRRVLSCAAPDSFVAGLFHGRCA